MRNQKCKWLVSIQAANLGHSQRYNLYPLYFFFYFFLDTFLIHLDLHLVAMVFSTFCCLLIWNLFLSILVSLLSFWSVFNLVIFLRSSLYSMFFFFHPFQYIFLEFFYLFLLFENKMFSFIVSHFTMDFFSHKFCFAHFTNSFTTLNIFSLPFYHMCLNTLNTLFTWFWSQQILENILERLLSNYTGHIWLFFSFW